MIEAHGLAKYFGRFSALRDLHLKVEKGEFIALFGRNGAGKTTFLRILAGLSHSTALYADLTAHENLRFYARLLDLPCGDGDVEKQIERVGLAGRGREPVRNYSRGMQQRLAIARAFLHDPEILLLDEPFTGLDQTGTDFLKNYLADAHARGRTCLMAIHDAPLGYEVADRLVVIEKGVVALDVPKQSLSLGEFQARYRALSEER